MVLKFEQHKKLVGNVIPIVLASRVSGHHLDIQSFKNHTAGVIYLNVILKRKIEIFPP